MAPRLGLAAALVTAAACGSPAAPTSPASQTGTPGTPTVTVALSGVWAGYLSATDCPVGYPCSAQRLVPFVLRIGPSGPAVAAGLEVTDSSNGVVMDVTGIEQPDGSVLFTGHRGEIDSDQANVELRRLLVKLDSATGLTGEIDLRRYYTNGGLNRVLQGRILSAAYQPFVSLPGQTLAGRWTGMAVIRKCEGYCRGSQTVGDDRRIELTVGQSGTALSGQLLVSNTSCSSCWMNVTGTASGGALSLVGAPQSYAASQGTTLRLPSFEGTLDHLGRLTGRFTFEGDSHIAISPFAISFRLECDILWLTRQ